jgi:plastocyanin
MSFVAIRAIDDPNAKRTAVIEVRGYQWSWTFDYGTNAAGTRVLVKTPKNTDPPQMIVPVGETVHIEERSDNVIHSFFVPAFLFKRDVVPGKANGFDMTVKAPGIYQGQCAELCGTDHAKMTFTVKAVGRTEFDKWFNSFVPPRPKCEETGKASDKLTISSVPGAAQFEQECVYAKAGAPVTIEFVNGGGLPHNVAVVKGIEPTGSPLAKGDIVDAAGAKSTTNVPAVKAGDEYTFFCQVHPLMQGRYVVQ